ncbi:preprotein translocase subunit SecB [Solirubrobacter pauli]|uniref:Preprotein translocase subunit SecB n=1 Tax=Solirubrobacter pauli TaxID=166793 RepID=A0A660L7I5_9ACTN|nr:protein-export chaperone SecB [Solirubrobacter pauli]RKQ90459.1 preprotein translocase subunit SecB [Solirubrobacter pauli]
MPPESHNSQGQLLDAVLSEVHFRRNLDFDWDKGGVSYVLNTRTEAEVSDDRDHGRVHLHVDVNFQREEGQDEDPFEIKLVVTGMFAWLQPDLPDEEIRGWLSFNGEHLLWPYLRAFISQLTTAAGAAPLVIYTIGIPRPHLGRSDETGDFPKVPVEDEAR